MLLQAGWPAACSASGLRDSGHAARHFFQGAVRKPRRSRLLTRAVRGPSPAQAGDLRRLLGLYEQWHRRLFPYLPFDGFLEELEKVGQTASMKVRAPLLINNL